MVGWLCLATNLPFRLALQHDTKGESATVACLRANQSLEGIAYTSGCMLFSVCRDFSNEIAQNEEVPWVERHEITKQNVCRLTVKIPFFK